MSCEHPLIALDLGIDPETGKHHLKILPKRYDYNLRYLEEQYGVDSVLCLPCGQCASCRLAHRKEWSTRCMLEASLYEKNSFVTLTYNDENVPSQLDKKHFQKFIKDLRNAGYNCRYFGCGEYGSHTFRPHYHILLFGYRPEDLKPVGKSPKTGELFYESKELNKIWNRGFVSVGDVTYASCGYVAGYVDKKLDKPGLQGFVLMSNKPGIGADYFSSRLKDIYTYDNLILKNGNVVFPPRYCDKIAERNGVDLTEIKAKRIESQKFNLKASILKTGYRNKEEVIFHQGQLQRDKLTRKKRGL